jgi:4-hydroxythreonine-4-phosphate dehydrogenase
MTGDAAAPSLALTMGEPAGIGGEIALLAWRRRRENVPAFFLIDDADRLRRLAAQTGIDAAIETIEAPEQARAAFPRALPVLDQPVAATVAPGRPDPAAAAAVLGSIDRAIALAIAGRTAAVVTNPIHKAALYAAGFRYPGHTEYLADKARLRHPPVMMLAAPALRVVPVTIHLSLREAIATLTTDAIVHCGRLAAEALARDFAVAQPRLAIAGLNPHAGEDGHMGREDLDIVAPAVARLCAAGIDARGPLAPDTMFHAAARAGYDAALCMYHDQALIPLKTLDFDGGVNVTLGLPFVRTSPDHGTAFDIAGTGKARPDSLMAALRLADALSRNRRAAERGRSVA